MTTDGKQTLISTSTTSPAPAPPPRPPPSVLSEDCARLASAESAAASAVERAAELAELLASAARGEKGSAGTAVDSETKKAATEAASAFLAAVREAQETLIPAAKRYERPGEPPFAGDAAPERARKERVDAGGEGAAAAARPRHTPLFSVDRGLA